MKYRLKKGYGNHYIGKKMYKAGDVIEARPDELSGAMDKFEQLEPDPLPPEPKVKLIIVERTDGAYDVVNEISERCINDEPLEYDAARSIAGDDANVVHIVPDDVDSDEEEACAAAQSEDEEDGEV